MSDNINKQLINDLIDLMEDEFPILLETFLNDSEDRLAKLEAHLV